MSFDTITLLSLPLLFLAFMAVEAFARSGRTMPEVRHWRLIGIFGLMVTLLFNALLPTVFQPLLVPLHVLDLGDWGLWAAGPTVVLTTFLTYWSHRIQHRFDLLWRLGHQLHHSVARVDIASAMIFHPIDVAVQVAMTILAATLLGVSAHAAGLAGVIGFAIALYQHWDVATPRWTGWFIQRPEAHMLHHRRDVHALNFGDMPVWDMIFGTYDNPERADVEVGFADGRARRVMAMIACVDVNRTEGRLRI